MVSWKILPFVVAVIFITPILIVFTSLFGEYSDNWSHLLVIGVLSAYLVTNYSFYGKNTLEWALLLPLAIPPYILAYTFTGLFDVNGDANILIRYLFNLNNDFVFFPNVRNITGAIIVFSFTLYPYVYLVTRSAFLNQSNSIKESGRL